MTYEENAAVVRKGYEAFNAGDGPALAALLREDVTFYQPGASVVAGDYRGRDAVLGFFASLAEHSAGTFQATIEELYASDREAIVVHRATGRVDGRELVTRTAMVIGLDGGRVASFSVAQEDQEAFDAFFAA